MKKKRIYWGLPAALCLFMSLSAQTDEPMWIWGETPVNETGKSTTFFRLQIDLPDDPVAGECLMMVDDNGALHVNGAFLAPVFYEQRKMRIPIFKYELKPHLRKGKNILALQCNNNGGPGGVILKGSVRMADGRVVKFASNAEWKTSMTRGQENWASLDFDASSWRPASEIGSAAQKPWADMSNAREVFGIQTGK